MEVSQKDIDREILSSLKNPDIRTSSLAKEISSKFSLPRKKIYNRILYL